MLVPSISTTRFSLIYMTSIVLNHSYFTLFYVPEFLTRALLLQLNIFLLLHTCPPIFYSTIQFSTYLFSAVQQYTFDIRIT
jgi:hypothetical protein